MVHDEESQRMGQKGGVLFSWVSLDLTVLPALWKDRHTTLWFTMLPVLAHTMCLKPRHLLMASYETEKTLLFQGSKQKPERLWMPRGVPLRKELGRQWAFALGPVGKSGATLCSIAMEPLVSGYCSAG